MKREDPLKEGLTMIPVGRLRCRWVSPVNNIGLNVCYRRELHIELQEEQVEEKVFHNLITRNKDQFVTDCISF